MRGLDGKHAVITGAAQGIGLATAERFYEEGALLCLVDSRPLDQTVLTEKFSERFTYIEGDVRDAFTQQAVLDYVRQNRWDVLVNNAGVIRDAMATKMTQSDWDDVISINLTALFRWCQLAGQVMREQQAGVILNAASVVAHYGNVGQANYVASKAGVVGLTKTLAKELGPHGVRVNAVAPGFVATPMVGSIPDGVVEMMQEKTPLRRLGKPEDVAAAYAFLASHDAAYVTGATLCVDGGLVIG